LLLAALRFQLGLLFTPTPNADTVVVLGFDLLFVVEVGEIQSRLFFCRSYDLVRGDLRGGTANRWVTAGLFFSWTTTKKSENSHG
jgi:hypothetical protein